jgi:hypothetical protein
MMDDRALQDDGPTSSAAGFTLTRAAHQARYHRAVGKPRRTAGLVAHKAGMNGGSGPSRTVYRPLLHSLAAHTEPVEALTFAEIEAILDAALPPTARTEASFWRSGANAHVRALRAAGWRVHFHRRRDFIISTRDAEG